MLSHRTRVFIIVNLGLLLILGVSIFLLVMSKRRQPAAKNSPVSPAGQVIDSANFTPEALPAAPIAPPSGEAGPYQPTARETEQNAGKQLAKIFIERYGTYSTQNNFQNIRDVEPLVTAALWKKLSARFGTPPGQSFVGVTTEVFSSAVADWQDAAATIALKTKRTTDSGGAVTHVYQGAKVMLVKQGGVWLVDSFAWE